MNKVVPYSTQFDAKRNSFSSRRREWRGFMRMCSDGFLVLSIEEIA